MRHSCVAVTTGEVGIVTPLGGGINSNPPYIPLALHNGRYSHGGMRRRGICSPDAGWRCGRV
jgi:hypothetical protein